MISVSSGVRDGSEAVICSEGSASVKGMVGLYPVGLICSIYFEQKDAISTFPLPVRPVKVEYTLRASFRIKTTAALLAGAWLLVCARAQETIRMSLAGAEAAEARRKANSTIGYYNLKLGLAAVR